MRLVYRIDRTVSSLSDFLVPEFMKSQRLSVYRVIAKIFGKIGIPWCFWPQKDFDFEFLVINPEEIEFQVKDGLVPVLDNTKFWKRATKFGGHPTIYDIFVEKLNFKETEQYKNMTKRIENGGFAYWCKNKEDITLYFERIVETYNSMKEMGYLSATQMGTPKENVNDVYPNEILVSRGGDQRLYLERGGTHRLTIAKVLGLKQITVAVIRDYTENLP
jgi:hypothetical protein